MKAFTQAVGFRRADVGVLVLDLLGGQIQLEGMPRRPPTVFSAVVDEQVLDLHSVLLVERQHEIVLHIHRRHQHFRQVQFLENVGSVRVDHRLQVDFPNTFDGAHGIVALAQQVSRMRRFDVLFGIDQPPARFGQQAHLRLGQRTTQLGSFTLQPLQALVAHHESAPLPDVWDE